MAGDPEWPMIYFKTEKPYQDLRVTEDDMKIASIAFGWTLGFGYFTACHAIRETRRARRLNTYVYLIWSELLVCLIFAIICWLYLDKVIPGSFWFFMAILTTWALQVQFLLQIIVNRICILLPNNYQRNWLRWGIAGIILAINISVYCIWIPAKLQISERYHDINIWWDRCEKSLYLVVDGILNWYFIHTVKQRLIVHGGLKKYAKLVRYNTQIVWLSLSMDVLIISMMSLSNDFVYMQFHPVAYTVKLNIEMAMSNLIIKVARDTGIEVYEDDSDHSKGAVNATTRYGQQTAMEVQVHRHQVTHHDNEIELKESPPMWSGKGDNLDMKDSSTKASSVDLAVFPPSSDAKVELAQLGDQ